MGVSGAMGFRMSGKDHITHNGQNSGPGGLGARIVKFLDKGMATSGHDGMVRELKQRVSSLVAVDENVAPTEAQQKHCLALGIVDLEVSRYSVDDWYCLLYRAQGHPDKVLAAKFYVPDDGFLNNGAYCEYAYIINLDDETLEFYGGRNKLDGTRRKNRYWDQIPENKLLPFVEQHVRADGTTYTLERNYGPVALLLTLPLAEIASTGAKETVQQLKTSTGD